MLMVSLTSREILRYRSGWQGKLRMTGKRDCHVAEFILSKANVLLAMTASLSVQRSFVPKYRDSGWQRLLRRYTPRNDKTKLRMTELYHYKVNSVVNEGVIKPVLLSISVVVWSFLLISPITAVEVIVTSLPIFEIETETSLSPLTDK